ncbi:ROK family transcriptional regulator [Paenibacillus nasutitermitis]|uniref:Sugar kinase n=1 Tax=Paenibacillus nasutitermitis TaxID=1652958 RepID=A0A916YKQ6_9BACL|nr:ROK family transcriptional regulator [Paenibacillus nasutitermitis]GGD50440.1 sugar kinase [Paenibacillus nasutitermitis]
MEHESSQRQLKRINESIVLHAIRQKAPISRAALASYTGLSPQTLTNVVRRFLVDGFLVESGTEESGGRGRSRVRLELYADGAYAIGFCMERDSLSMGLVDLKGRVLDYKCESIEVMESPQQTMKRMTAYASSILQGDGYAPIRSRIIGIGVGTPGPIDYDKGEVVSPPNYEAWARIPIRSFLHEELGCPVVIDNSSTVAAIGEHWAGRWGTDSFLYCYWGMGIGGGLIAADKVYRGQSGNAIELGHIVVESRGRACQCGGQGCLEAYASIPALLREASAYGEFRDFGQLLKAAEPGTVLREILDRAAEYMAQAMVTAINLLDVDFIVLGGDHVHLAAEIFLPVMKRRIAEQPLRAKVAAARVGVSSLKQEAGVIGAASLVFHELLLGQ